PRFAELTYDAASAPMVSSDRGRRSQIFAITKYRAATTNAVVAATYRVGEKITDRSEVASASNSRAGVATKNTRRERTTWPAGPSDPVRPSTKPIAMITKMTLTPANTPDTPSDSRDRVPMTRVTPGVGVHIRSPNVG